jgi:hypothetical protein
MVGSLLGWGRQIGLIFAAHAGLVVLMALVAGWPWPRGEPAPVIVRQRVHPFARQFVFFFALAPALAGSLLAIIIGIPGWIAGVAPLVILSGLAAVIIAGDDITLVRQHILIAAWFGLLLVPPIMAAGATVVMPWLGVDLRVGQPVQAMARFFHESFQRRTGSPLHIVGGDTRTAALIALGAPGRPDLFINAAPEHSPWVTMDAIKSRGAMMVWPTTDTGGTPPGWLKQQFPDLVAEVPRVFERRVQGRLPLLRIGWAVIRPRAPETQTPTESK